MSMSEDRCASLEEAKAALAQFNERTGYLQSKVGDNRRKEYLDDFEARRAKDSISPVLRIRCGRSRKTSRDHRQQLLRRSFCFGNLTTEQAMNSLCLFADEVMPAFRGSTEG